VRWKKSSRRGKRHRNEELNDRKEGKTGTKGTYWRGGGIWCHSREREAGNKKKEEPSQKESQEEEGIRRRRLIQRCGTKWHPVKQNLTRQYVGGTRRKKKRTKATIRGTGDSQGKNRNGERGKGKAGSTGCVLGRRGGTSALFENYTSSEGEDGNKPEKQEI